MADEKTQQSGYATYQGMVAQVNTGLVEMKKLCENMRLKERAEELSQIRERLTKHSFAVGVMGEFKRGKSTVINSMLEKEIMPADILPCSATMNRVTYDLHPHVELRMRDGSVRSIAVGELSSYVTKLTSDNESRAAEVDEAVVYYPCRFCQNGVDIVDTPGLNDDERMNKISEEVIPKLDAVIMVLTPDNPFSMSEAEFVRNKLMTSDLGRLIFLVNKIDQIRRPADRVRVVESIRQKIQSSVLEKMAAVYGTDSKEYEDAQSKMGNIRIFPISALDALDGKMAGDQQLIEQSGTLEFEAALTKMLTEERGALELSAPLNAINRTAVEIAKAAATRKNALALSAQEFEDCQKEALEEIRQLREKKRAERKRLQESSGRVRSQLEMEVMQFYPQLKAALQSKVDEAAAELDPVTLAKQAGQEAAVEKLQGVVSQAMTDEMSLFSERIHVQLQEILGEEAIQIGQFFGEVSNRLDMTLAGIGGKKSGLDASEIAASGMDALMGGLGIGGIVSGYKNAGIKGALVGGGIAFASYVAVCTGFMLAFGAFSLPISLVCAVAGSLSGKFFTKKIFKKDVGLKELEKIKEAMHKGVDELIAQMQYDRELEKWVEDLVDNRFTDLIRSMEDECERMLKDTESNMDSIKQDLTQNEFTRRQLEEDCNDVIAAVEKLQKELSPVVDRVRYVLENA